MDEKEVPSSCLFKSEDRTHDHNLYPMYFGVSCAFVALKLLLQSDLNGEQQSETRDRMLQGSAHLLGLLVWRIRRGEATEGRPDSETLQRLKKAEIEVVELKKRRSEDAKANEKVVSIFAAQEQIWLSEMKKLRQQIGALLHEFRVLKTKKEEIISNLNENIYEKEGLIESRDKSLEEEEGKRKELEEKLQKAEADIKELRETRKKEAEEHSSELRKHKTAFIELVSNHRQLESEMGRALRQVDAAKQELDSVIQQKEESILMVQKLSVELVKMRKDSDQKDKILSAMLRKSKLDTTEKQMLLKELKISKARRKEAEIKMEKWKAFNEYSRHENHSMMLSNLAHQAIEAGCSQNRRINSKNFVLEYLEADQKQKSDYIAPKKTVNVTSSGFNDPCSPLGNGELVIRTNVKQLEDLVQSETERHTEMLQQRHHLEIEAFSEQLGLKDEKLEAFHWRLLSSELEVKLLKSQLDQNLLQLKDDKMKQKTMLSGQETKLKSLQGKFISSQLSPPHSHEAHWNSSPKDLAIVDPVSVCSNAKITKRKVKERDYPPTEVETLEEEQDPPSNHSKDTTSVVVQVPEDNIVVEKEVLMDMGHVEEQCRNVEAEVVAKPSQESSSLIKKDTSWKVDLHAVGVSYNIKRLKQQLLLLEKLVGLPEICKEWTDEKGNLGTSFHLLMPLLNRQVSRYQSLQEKIDDLCRRMHEHGLDGNVGSRRVARTKDETRTLESLLVETFQLQRYMVATGQKLMDIQSRMSSGFVAGDEEEAERSANFDMRRFSDNVRTLFKEVQKGLEVRIARVIGNLEGTLTSGRSFDSGIKSS